MTFKKTREEDFFCGMNKPAKWDSEGMIDFEKEQTPVIDAPSKGKAGEPFTILINKEEKWEKSVPLLLKP